MRKPLLRIIAGVLSVLSILNFTANAQITEKSGYYEEESGLLILEAENYNLKYDRIPTNGTQQLEHAWINENSISGFSGTGYMSNLPDEQCETCTEHNSPKDGSGAEMVFNVKISTVGTYKVWVRGRSIGGESNGIHIQVDGDFITNSAGTNMSGFRPHNQWVWEHGHKDYAEEPNIYLTGGFHTIHIYSRDDGFMVDKVVLGINQDTAPSEEGPDESNFINGDQSGNTNYYCDPVNGSMSNNGSQASPWSSLEDVFIAGKTFEAGDVINLLSGYHGDVNIVGNNSDHVIIRAETGEQPELKKLEINSASYWTIKGLKISPELAGEEVEDIGAMIKLRDNCNNIIIENCELYSIDDNSDWDADDWVSLSRNGINLDGDHNIFRNCIVRNIDHGIFVDRKGDYNLIENNQVFNFSGDGMRGIGNYNTFQYNLIKDNYNVDDNHDDGFQSYSVGSGGSGTGTVYGNILRGNTFINISDPNRPFQGPLQGIGNFDGMFEDWIVENNIIISNHYNGITFLGATNCKIVNNTVIDPNNSSPGPLWIKIAAHKDGKISSGNLIRNNLCSNMDNDADIGTVDNNLVIAYSEYDKYFVDFANFDLHLKPGCPAIDAGSSDDVPAIDIEGSLRPYGNGYDVGAYENTEPYVAVTGFSLSTLSLTIDAEQVVELIASVAPEDATNQAVLWTSSNPSVVSVDQDGRIYGLWGGSATIKAKTEEGEFYQECQVTVNPSADGLYNLALSKPVTVSAEPQATNPAANLVNGNTTRDSRWSAEGFPQWAEIDLGEEYALSRIELYTMDERAYQYTIMAKTDVGEYVTIIDKSDNTDAGPIIDDLATSGRYIKIEVIALHGASSAWVSLTELKVYGDSLNPATGVSLSENTLNLFLNKTHLLTADVTPANASNKGVSWSTEDEDIVSVNDEGLIEAVGAGVCKITATSLNGGFTDECIVTVNIIEETGVSIMPETLELTVGESFDLTANVTPDDASYSLVTWSSSDPSIVSTNPYMYGKIAAKKEGTCTITAKTHSGIEAQCVVTVSAFSSVDDAISSQRPSIKIYPNPISTNGELRVELPGYNTNDEVFLKITDLTGKSIYQMNTYRIYENENMVLYLNNKLTTGMYFLSVNNGKYINQIKLLVR